MRLSLGLPALQTIAMIVILWAPWSPETHKFDIVLRDGREIRGLEYPARTRPEHPRMAQGIHHPALLAEIPIDHASEEFQQFPKLNLHPPVATKGTAEKSSRLIGLYRPAADKKASHRQFNDHRFAGKRQLGVPYFLHFDQERHATFRVAEWKGLPGVFVRDGIHHREIGIWTALDDAAADLNLFVRIGEVHDR